MAGQMPESWSPFGTIHNTTNLDIELLKREVGQRFPFYDMRFNTNTVAFFCRIDKETLEKDFNVLRKNLSENGYIPMLRYETGEHIIYVIKKPKRKEKPVWVNVALFIATIITTTLAGSLLWVEIYGASWSEIFSLNCMLKGFIFFSIPLLSILGIHEMGHYFTSKRHNLDTSLPFFMPLPPPFILGTLGALISTKDPIPDRKALLDVGASGPICGFLVAIPVSLIGLFLMQQNPIFIPAGADVVTFTFPIVLQVLSSFFTIPPNTVMHPTLFAGWAGFFLTAVNLLPIGQLDGGHVSRAILKEKYKYASWAVIFLLLGLGMFSTTWLVFAFIILFMIGTQHQPPLNDFSSLDMRRKLIGVLVLIIFMLCFAPIPMSA